MLCGAPDSICNKLQKVQNYAARLVSGSSYKDHITPVMQSLHWLPVKARIDYKILVMVYQAIHKVAPDYLQELVQVYHPARSLRSASELRLQVPRCNSATYGHKSFKVVAATKWNSLPASIRDSPSVNSFKRVLKTHLFKSIYGL